MANNNLGTIRGTIEIDYDGAGIVRAVKGTDKAKGSMDRLDRSVSTILTTFRRFSKVAAVAGASSLAMNSSLQLIAGTLAVMGPLVAAGVAALPGILLAGAAAGVVAKVATLGVADALKEAGGDAAAFEEKIKGLAPEARNFARAWRSALTVLKPVQQAIQNAFFTGLASELNRIVPRIASLRAQAVGVAAAMNRLIREVFQFAGSSESIENVRLILSGLNAFLLRIRGSIGPIVSAFIDLGAQASAFGATFGERVGAALQRFAVFLQGVDVAAIFERALPILQSLGTFLSNMGSIVSNLFTVFNVDGANAAGILGELAGRLATFLESAQGQEALTALGQAMGAISGAAGQVFLTLLQELAPVIVALAPGVGQLATQLASVLVPAIRTLSPLLEALAGFLSENMDWVGPLAIAIVGAAAAYRTYTAAVKAWAAIESVAQALRLKSVGAWIANTAAIVANRVATVAAAAATAATRVPTMLAAAAQWLWNASLYGFPLVWIIAAIVAVIAIVILLVKNWDDVVKFFGKAWEWLKDIFFAGLNYLKSFWTAVWNGIIAYLQFVIDFWTRIFTTAWNWLKAGWKNVVDTIRNLIQLWLEGVRTAALAIRDRLRAIAQFFLDMRNAVLQRIGDALRTIREMPGRIKAALGNLGRLLYNAGRDLISGFIDGLLSMLRRVRDAASSVVNAVTDFMPGSPAKEGPLSGRGYVLLRARRMMADLARGIQDAQELPVVAMAGAVRPVAVAASGGISGASTGQRGTVVNNTTGGALTIGQVVLRGILDPTDPAAARRTVATLHEAIETYKKEYR